MRVRNVPGRYLKGVAPWRKMAAVAWKAPNVSLIYGSLELDIGNGLALIESRSRATGKKITVNHLVTKAIGETFRRHPECNAYIRRGKIYERDSIDISLTVAVEPDRKEHDQGADLSAAMIRSVDEKSLEDIADSIHRDADAVRRHESIFIEKTKKLYKLMPPKILQIALKATRWLEYDWNVNMAWATVPRDPFGSALITAIGSLGLKSAWAPIPPFMNVPIIISVGRVEERAVVRDGEVVVRPMLSLFATIDHRVIDGFQGAVMAKTLEEVLANPAYQLGYARYDETIHPPEVRVRDTEKTGEQHRREAAEQANGSRSRPS